MTGTSRALRRLGVAGLSTVLMTTGLAALAATSASAANVNGGATSIDIQPPGDAATVGTCNPFTATVAPTPGATDNYTITVVLSQQAATAAQRPAGTTIGFCDVSNFSDATAGQSQAGPSGTQQTPPPPLCPQTATSPASPAAPTTVTCQGNFPTPNGSGKVTFGVTSDTAGSMTVQAYVDKNRNGVFDSGIDPTKSVTKTWNANTAGSITCTPSTQSKAASPGATATFNCSVTTGAAGAGTPATGQDVKYHITAGPDADAPAALGHGCSEDANPNNEPKLAGKYTCTVTNNGITGTDDITAWVDVDHNGGIGSSEPTAAPIHIVWVAPAPNGSTNTVTCDDNVVATTTGPGSNVNSVCQDPLSDKSVKFTATIKSGVNSTNPVVGTLVSWSITSNTGGTGEQATDVETLTGDNGAAAGQTAQCTTDSSGSCSVTLTNSQPTEGEDITVTAKVSLASGGTSDATGRKRWHNPNTDEARNITLSPESATQAPGGAQAFKATVTDRFGNPVAGFCVGFSESGPGRFTANSALGINCFTTNEDDAGNSIGTDAACRTLSDGTCTVEVESQSTERGQETITASIRTNVTDHGGNPVAFECNAPAGFSYFNDAPPAAPGTFNRVGTTPNANGANNTATGAEAGNCTDNGTVTWAAVTPPPPHKTRMAATIHCFSPHRHMLKCKVNVDPNRSGLLVKFKRRIHGHVRLIGSDFTNSRGIAHITKRHLKRHKLWRVFAHVYATPTTTGVTTGTDRTRIK